ncbi:hypothetical protein PHMEG_00026533 [Phytophthora megakarya]|uniref:Non-structural maintenance of chromosomes element 4 n=1 Tax=Phytophthora megakarya TaxID=4795 RepID=A0A225VAL2_9STRA|nr:hypothetical protein PHMEG_00026533 [Phytophthora megakarya]
MRSRVTFTFVFALVAVVSWIAQVEAAACAEICYTTSLTGFGPGGASGCSCSGSQQGARTGSGSCSCGQCYEQTGSVVIGYAISSDGTCTYGTDCGDCTYSSDSSGTSTSSASSTSTNTTSSTSSTTGSTTTTTTDAPTTTSPTPTSGTSSNSTSGTSSSTTDSTNSPTTTTSSSSGSTNGNAGETAGSSAANNTSSDNGLKTWQIALIICCGVLVFTVAVVSVLSCYCKARNRLYENEDDQADASYYQQQYPRQRDDVVGSGGIATPTLFAQGAMSTRSHARSGSSGSLSEQKPMYANSANSGSSDRLGLGLAPVHMRHSSGDLAGMAGSYPNERILSGSYPVDRRPSASNRKRSAPSDSEEEKTQRADEEESPPRRRAAPPGRNRKGFLENSQLTERDRRQVRYKERELLQSIKENANDLAKLSSDTFDTHTQELDQMYDSVCYPREANLDASNLDELNVAAFN